MSSWLYGFAVVVSACFLLADEVQAEDLNSVVNSSFDTSVADWTQEANATLEWSALDVDGAPQSGSARVTNHDSQGAYGMSQCMELVSGAPYDFRAYAYVPGGQADYNYTQLRLWIHAGSGCSGETLSYEQRVVGSAPVDEWVSREILDISTQGAQSAFFKALIFKSGAGDATIHLDEITLVPEPAGALLSGAALLSLAGILAARRTHHGRPGAH